MQVGYLTNKPQYANEMADIIRLFYGEIDLRVNPITIEKLDLLVKENILENKLGWQFFYEVEGENYEKTAPFPQKGKGNREIILKRYEKRYGKQFLYEILKEKTGIQLPWGSLTGIRPARLVYEQLEAGYNLDRSMENVIELFDLTEDKADLLKKVVAFQQKMDPPHERGVSLYIGIPFCTTRCSYCTFSSGEIGNGELVAPYMKALLWEMKACEKLIKEKGLKVRTLYVGGGTPTALPSSQLKALIDQIKKYFPSLKELTVEAGRPDTIDEEKLRILKEGNVHRISVNPQTMKEETLIKIGRNHSPEETIKAYELAEKMGFNHINMDVIAGLPGERVEDFAHTLSQILPLKPQSITVHSLSLKRGSKLWDEREKEKYGENTKEMIQLARKTLERENFLPYYLYRQKYMSENQENVGYALEKHGCQYNVDMMEETTHILAMGAGGISKRLYLNEGRIERAPNVSNVPHYINRVEEMMERKRKLWETKPFF